jgi:hypothetical protein
MFAVFFDLDLNDSVGGIQLESQRLQALLVIHAHVKDTFLAVTANKSERPVRRVYIR